MSFKWETNKTSPNKTVNSQVYPTWGRKRTIEAIAIHWWGDPKQNPKFDNIVDYLCRPGGGSSAHLVASGTGRRVACIVDFNDAAWATNSANPYSIAIELDPRCRDEDYDVAAELIAQLRQVYGNLPLVPHKQFVATACPGNYDLNRLSKLAGTKLARPQDKWGTVSNKVTSAPKPAKKAVPNAVKLPKVLKFKAKLNPTNVWDLETNPNYKAATTLKKDAGFEAYAKIEFNNAIYYVTKYSFDSKKKVGVNSKDLVPVVDTPKAEVPVKQPESPSKPSEPESGVTKPVESKGVSEGLKTAFAKFIELLKEFWNS